MDAVFMTSLHFFCIAVLFDSISCSQIMLNNTYDNNKITHIAACMANCLHNDPKKDISQALNMCESSKLDEQRPLSRRKFDKSDIMLVCHNATSLVFQLFEHKTAPSIDINGTVLQDRTHENDFLYLINVEEMNTKNSTPLLYIATSPHLTINKNLKPNTKYNITSFIFNDNYEFDIDNIIVETMSTNYTPQSIPSKNIWVGNFTFNRANRTVDAEIYWQPNNDIPCGNDIRIYPTKGESDQLLAKEIREPENLYHYVAKNLFANTNYSIGIIGINNENSNDFDELIFTTPSCWNFTEHNLDICPPAPLSNLQTTYSYVDDFKFNINVTWDQPKAFPNYYDVQIIDLIQSDDDIRKDLGSNTTFEGDTNHAYFPGLILHGMEYEVVVRSYSKGGLNEELLLQTLNATYNDIVRDSKSKTTVMKFIIPLLTLLIAISIILVIRYRRLKIKQNEYMSKEIKLRELAQDFNKDQMEIDPRCIILDEDEECILGEGAFGVVKKGLLLPQKQDVAVKMLKEDASNDDVAEFFQEIILMKMVRGHPNIVGIVGHSTSDYNKMLLLTEYCSEGNLLNYLRLSRKYLKKADSSNIGNLIINKLYDNFNSPMDNRNLVLNTNNNRISCGSACKNHVEILKNIDSGDKKEPVKECVNEMKLNGECTIRIDDCCDCNKKNNKHNKRLFDEPRMILIENQECNKTPDPTSNCNSLPIKNLKQIKLDYMMPPGRCGDLGSRDLLDFAKQIASGMEFLAKHNIIHRDLAARNVLVCSDKTVKIADFGLSRNLGHDNHKNNIYLKSSGGRLPIKWLALESMCNRSYTTSSDVWSYGILLYEIVTLGNTPYPTVPADCLIDYLRAGNRMVKPNNCSLEFYDLMFSCWHCEPKERPTFTDISQKLDFFLSHRIPSELINIGFNENNQRMFKSNIPSELINIDFIENNKKMYDSNGYLKPKNPYPKNLSRNDI